MGSAIATGLWDEDKPKSREDAMRENILRLGRARLGEPDSDAANAIRWMTDLDQLGRLLDRSLIVESWSELISTH